MLVVVSVLLFAIVALLGLARSRFLNALAEDIYERTEKIIKCGEYITQQ